MMKQFLLKRSEQRDYIQKLGGAEEALYPYSMQRMNFNIDATNATLSRLKEENKVWDIFSIEKAGSKDFVKLPTGDYVKVQLVEKISKKDILAPGNLVYGVDISRYLVKPSRMSEEITQVYIVLFISDEIHQVYKVLK